MTKKIQRSEEEWRALLHPDQYHVCREKGTEAPFTGKYTACKEEGVYQCSCCGNPLFHSTTKYDSGSGWPSFSNLIDEAAVDTPSDTSHGMRRVEVACKVCNAHLGHVFEDGPEPSGLRYCINSISLALKEKE